jgi:hypothetical protein
MENPVGAVMAWCHSDTASSGIVGSTEQSELKKDKSTFILAGWVGRGEGEKWGGEKKDKEEK